MAVTTARPMTTAILPVAGGPSPLEARPELWAMAAPAISPSTVMALSVLPSPESTSCRRGRRRIP